MWFDRDADLLPGLLPGVYRGVTFHVPDTSIAAGRRVAEYLFPGVDLPAYDDFGLYPADVTIEGMLLGDDYVAQAASLQSAFETPGPGMLIHPWLGPMTVILREPGSISFSDRELRLARFSVSFVRYQAGAGGFIGSTLSALGTAVSAVATAASALSASVGRRVISNTRLKAADRSGRIVRTKVSALTAPSGARRFLPRLIASLPSGTVDPAAYDAMMVAIAGRISETAPTPAVAPAAGAPASDAADPAALVTLGLALTSSLSASVTEAPSPVDAMLLIAGAAHVVAATARQAIMVEYDSRDDALSYRAGITDLLGTLATDIEDTDAGLMQAEATVLRRALRSLGSAIIADVNETIGRLPPLHVFTPGRPVDAFLVAHHLAGDTPDQVEAVYADIVRRNRPRHPAALDGERIEVRL